MGDKVNIGSPNSHVVIITRSDSNSIRRRDSPAVISEQIYPETDTFCLLPSRMRCLCILLTILLIISLAAAIGNSIQSAGFKSISFCKTELQDFGPDVLCPKETMFHYFECCDEIDEHGSLAVFCCPQFKIWFGIAMISVFLSFSVGIVYTILRYIVKCF